MNLRALANFLSVAETGSLQGAANVVHIAQPALTRQIALLEEEFGTRLFVRHHRGVTLTEAGERLREHAERILAEVAKTRAAMSNAAERPTGSVSLGLPTAMRYVLSSDVIVAYHDTYPDVQLKVHEAFAHVIEGMLHARQIDVAILFDLVQDLESFEVTPLATENVYLTGPADAGLALDRPVSVKDLADFPILLLSKRNQLHLATQQAMARHGIDFRPFLEVEGEPLTVDLVRRGIGYTIRPFCAVHADVAAGDLSAAPIRDLTITWVLGVSRVRAHAPAVREMVALIRAAVDKQIAGGMWRKPRSDRQGKPSWSAASRAHRRRSKPAIQRPVD